MFECFHFQHFEQVSQRFFFYESLSAIYCSNSEHSLRMDSVELGELLFFNKGRVLFFLCIILLFICGTVQFQFVSSPKQKCVRGSHGKSFLTSAHPLTLILKQCWLKLDLLGF